MPYLPNAIGPFQHMDVMPGLLQVIRCRQTSHSPAYDDEIESNKRFSMK